MSEAADAERDVEDFFNEEIFGAKPEEEKQEPFPQAPPPEPKPIEDITVDSPDGTPEEGTPGGDIPAVDSDESPAESVLDETQEVDTGGLAGEPEETDDEYLVWAKKQYGDDLDPDKLARAAYEKEKLLGKRAEEARRKDEEAQEREIQARIDALNTPGILSPEEDAWVDEATIAGDPGSYAYDALQAGRPDLYAAVMDRWSTIGEVEARRARALHSQVLQLVTQPQPSEAESYAAALGETFVSLGLDIDQHGPLVLAKLEELGINHLAVEGVQSPDPVVRRMAVQGVVDLIRAGQTTVAKAKTDDVVAARVQEEQLRQQAAGVTTGGPREEQPKSSPFWDEFNAEIAERGWDGNRPTYGRGE